MNRPFPAYKGTDSYVFVCYAHKDADSVYNDLLLLAENQINVWYDEGIPAGKSWRGEIATSIAGAAKFVFFISEASLNSTHCLREVDFAVSHDIEIIPVYLDTSALPAELELVLNRVHALFRHTDSRYRQHLLEALNEEPGSRTKTALVHGRTRRRPWGIGLVLLALGVSAIGLWIWTNREVGSMGEPASAVRAAGPNAYDRYLDGLQRIKRWDLDDNLNAAISAFRQASELDPSFALAYARLADALRMRYMLTRDDASLREAAVNAEQAARLNASLAPVQVALGRIQAAQGNTDLALAALQRAIAIDPNDASAHQGIATVYADLGRANDAEASFRQALTLDPDNINILDAYANFLSNQGRRDDAIEQWRAVIRIAPDDFAALVDLGSALSDNGRIAEAITFDKRAIALRPSYMAYSNLGTAFSRAKRYPEAVEAYRKALEIDDSRWLAWGNLGYVYSWMNGMDGRTTETFERAIRLAEDARQHNARDPYVHSYLALYYAKTGQKDLAVKRLATALALSPDASDIQANAAEVYELIGQRDKAITYAKRSLQLGYSRRLMSSPEMANLLDDPRMQTSR